MNEAEDLIGNGIRKYFFAGGCWEDLLDLVEKEAEWWQQELEYIRKENE